MKVVVFAGYSGAGKTTLVERVIAELRGQGRRVSVIKHAHHKFDIDHPGKDSWRHRQAGAFEVVVASDRRMALMREFEQPTEPDVHHLLAELWDGVDWVLVEGFKHCDLHKVEVMRRIEPGQEPRPALYPLDDSVCAIATDTTENLPQPTDLPVFDLDDAAGVAQWLLQSGERFVYHPEHHV
ncbi:molybdopterin-guanine dinucleotide biosynthesis protein B [Pseudacidovorax sp. 1753]|uniref:molybdopterin-guanine dinucleotide biosynthesis protein B n=1 Tax=Pseudacidovorax sp. 1753 TaxID=3156419 RepID=UPI003390E1C5